jgi:hypothetical protein
MKMALFKRIEEKISFLEWKRDPEFCLMDTMLENHPELLDLGTGE